MTMWSRDLVLVLGAVACLFLNYPVLLIVGPVALREARGAAGDAGIMTAFFSGATVCTELLSPGLLVRASPARMLVMALGVMSLGTLASTAAVENPTALLALAPVRGIGFGAAVVAMSVLVTELAPLRRRGAALGWLGLTTSLPSMFGPALGLALLARVGAAGVFAMGGVATLIGMGLAAPVRQASVAPPAESGSVWRGLKRRDMLGRRGRWRSVGRWPRSRPWCSSPGQPQRLKRTPPCWSPARCSGSARDSPRVPCRWECSIRAIQRACGWAARCGIPASTPA